MSNKTEKYLKLLQIKTFELVPHFSAVMLHFASIRCCLDVRNQARYRKFVGQNKIKRRSSKFLLCFQTESKDFIAEIFPPASSSSYVANTLRLT